jgi:hypothetical protein
MAHRSPTGLRGRSRGLNHRVRDWIHFPRRYVLLCRWCHREHDRLSSYAERVAYVGELRAARLQEAGHRVRQTAKRRIRAGKLNGPTEGLRSNGWR